MPNRSPSLPLPPPPKQREIQPQSYRSVIQLAQPRRIALQLPTITFLLAIQKGIQSPAFVGARLVVDDPADAAGIHEAAVHDRGDRLAVLHGRGGEFAFG